MNVFRRWAMAAAGAVALFAIAGPASAVPISFTWSPGGVGLTGGNITGANNFNVSDFASIQVNTGTGAFSETGALLVTNFLNGGFPLAAVGLNTTYALYVTFTGTGFQGPIPPVGSSSNGVFTSLSYTLWASPQALTSIIVAPGSVTINGNAGAFALATGSLIAGQVTLAHTTTGFSPTANIDATFVVCTAAGGDCTGDESAFFVAPPPGEFSLSFLEGNFSATPSVTSLIAPCSGTDDRTCIDINGGGGNVTFAAPEPSALALVGSALLGLGLLGRKRKAAKMKKAA